MDKRPVRSTEKIAREAAEAMYPKLHEWLEGQDGYVPEGSEEDEKESVVSRVAKAIQYEENGYQVAKDLERVGWDPDAELVDLLDTGVSRHKEAAYERAVEAWVMQEGLKPAKKVGDLVSTRSPTTSITGTVVRVDEKRASYVINSPALGHKPPDLTKDFNSGRYMPFEDVVDGVLVK
jgi:hypothetical protein